MRGLRRVTVGLLGLLAAGLAAAAAPVDSLAWLVGTWSFERNGRTVTEHWLPPAGGTMLGVSRTTTGERTLEYEFIVLRADESGQIFYVAKPSGQPEAAFKLVRVSASGDARIFRELHVLRRVDLGQPGLHVLRKRKQLTVSGAAASFADGRQLVLKRFEIRFVGRPLRFFL